MSRQKVALYGLGNMGYLVAERIARHFPLLVADLNETALLQATQALQAQAIRQPQDVAETRIVVLCLPSPAASLAVLRQIAPLLQPGSIVVETSTVNPEDIHACQRVLAKHDIHLIDASIMAGVSQMRAGTASLLIGGAPDIIEQAKPVLDAITEKQIVFGQTGSGAAAKVINNAVAHAVMVVVAEAGALATAAGVDCHKLVALLADPSMGLHRPLTHRYAERIMQDDYAGGMPLDAARKDSTLALTLGQALGVPLFAIQASHTVYDIAAASGYGRDDYAAVAKIWADWGKPAAPPKAGATG